MRGHGSRFDSHGRQRSRKISSQCHNLWKWTDQPLIIHSHCSFVLYFLLANSSKLLGTMYSIYLETVKRRHNNEANHGQPAPEGKQTDASSRKEILKSDSPQCESSSDRPTLRRTTTPFPGSSTSHHHQQQRQQHPLLLMMLTKRDSSCTAGTALLSDDDDDEEDDLGGEYESDWDAFIKDIYSDGDDDDDDDDVNHGSSFSYSVDEGSRGDDEEKVDCPVKASNTSVKEEGSFSSFTDSDDASSLSLDSLSVLEDDDDDDVEEEDSSLPPRTTIQILPGLHLPFRGSEETKKAIENHCITSMHCTCCEQILYCSQDVTHVLCSECQVVSPVYSVERHRPAVGVGWNEEKFSSHLDQQWHCCSSSSSNHSSQSQSSLPMPPLI
jgi:hypothetical protein